jgi:hypothetical protein
MDVFFQFVVIPFAVIVVVALLLAKTASNEAELKSRDSRRRAKAAASDCSGSPTTPRP